MPASRWPAPLGDALVASLPQLRRDIDAACGSAPRVELKSSRMLAPVARPARVIAVRTNYRDRATEGDSRGAGIPPDLFLKAVTSVTGPAAGVDLRWPARRTDHEVELAVVIGSRAERVAVADALESVAGYCIGIDLTLRGDEDRGLRKSLDGYTVLGPWLTTPDEAGHVGDARILLSVNGVVRQDGRTSDMVHGVAEIVAHASSYFPLLPGDVILTGTPAGAGPVSAGDVMHCAIEGLGEMSVQVRAMRAHDA